VRRSDETRGHDLPLVHSTLATGTLNGAKFPLMAQDEATQAMEPSAVMPLVHGWS
jgi:hypothetical protein